MRHVRYIQKRMAALEPGGRLMIFLPPRSYKSELVTVRYTAWTLSQWPRTACMIGCYNQTLANTFSRKVRKIVRENVDMDPERRDVTDWWTATGGGLRAAGVGSGVTGRGADLLVIDDPVRSRADANSESFRDRMWGWYRDDLYTRLEPGARLVLIMTRWHESDLAGRILEEESEEGWEIIRMPAIAETQAQRDEWADRHHRPLGEPDPIGRKPGEALVPERFDLADIEQQRRIMGRSFQALMQQSPQELEGGMFQIADWIEINRDELPPMVSMVRSWDKAATQDGGKRTAGVLMGRSAQGLYFVLDVVKGHWGSAEREQVMIETADNDAATWKNRHIIVEQEPGSGGKDSAELSLINLSMYVAEAKRVTGDKETRAEPFAAAVGNGLVYVVRGQWTREYKQEHAVFPSGSYSDQVDASSGAYNWLAEQPLFRRKPGRTEVLAPRRRPGRPQRKARKR